MKLSLIFAALFSLAAGAQERSPQRIQGVGFSCNAMTQGGMGLVLMLADQYGRVRYSPNLMVDRGTLLVSDGTLAIGQLDEGAYQRMINSCQRNGPNVGGGLMASVPFVPPTPVSYVRLFNGLTVVLDRVDASVQNPDYTTDNGSAVIGAAMGLPGWNLGLGQRTYSGQARAYKKVLFEVYLGSDRAVMTGTPEY